MSKEQVTNEESRATLEQMEHAFQLSFSADILADPSGWTPEYPAFGHCSAAAQIAHDLFGGEIHGFWFNELAKRWGEKIRGSHFLNILPGGLRRDFTRSQFPPDFPYDEVMAPDQGKVVDREKMFGDAGSAGQYARLKIAVTRNLWVVYGIKIDCPFLSKSPWESDS